MRDIVFSSWGGRIVDNREKEPQTYEVVDHVTVPEYFKGDEKIKALIGWNGILIRSPEVDIIDLCKAYLEAGRAESIQCDKCNYCKTGYNEILDVFKDLYSGEARAEDLEFMQSAAEAIMDAGKCSIGKSGPVALLQALRFFSKDFSQALGTPKTTPPFTYYSTVTAPCMDACPIHLDVPKYIELIKDAKFIDSLNVIRDRLPIPGCVGRICVRPCEENCRRSNVDEPISIRALKRFVADQELLTQKEPHFSMTPSPKTGNVVVIGGGPAGLTCAYHLARMGHKVTIYEKLSLPGGMMTVGVPQFSLPRDILLGEIEAVLKMGVTLKTDMAMGKGMSLDGLKDEGYQAVFLATGLHGSRRLGIEGETLPGVMGGVEFLRDVALGKAIHLGKKVIVVGGGNVAVDVARTLRRLGGEAVTMVCLESRTEMPAWQHEIEAALEEGVEILNGFGPRRFLQQDGKVKGVELKRCTRVFDEDRHFHPQYDETDLKTLTGDSVIVAIGQSEEPDLRNVKGIPMSKAGMLQADPLTFQTPMKWVFAAGDAVYGPESVIEAAASGRRAALSIDRFINGLPVVPDDKDYFDRLLDVVKVFDPHETIVKVEPRPRRQSVRRLPAERMSDFQEVEKAFTSPEAVAEAERCLRCYRVVTVAV